MSGLPLNSVLSQLKQYAPLHLADQSWDNVGLLVEPDETNPNVERIFFTNDLTEPVLDEAIKKRAQLIVSYHPPIFSGLKRLTQSSWKERIVVKCIKHGIAVYSPHTSWDAVSSGINDWLISAFGRDGQDYTSSPIESVKMNETPTKSQHLLTITVPRDHDTAFITNLSSVSLINQIDCQTSTGPAIQLSLGCSPAAVSSIVDRYQSDAQISKTIQLVDLQKPLDTRQGYGRSIELKQARTIGEVVQNVKRLTGLEHVRLALANGATVDSPIRTIAVCAGSGSSVFAHVKRVEMQITGELSHHAVLDAIHRGTSVILCDHTNTERGFLQVIKKHFEQIWSAEQLTLLISERDRDPLVVV